jgi:hypothetical protein
MAAQAWKIYAAAKRKLGRGELTLHTGNFRMSLYRNSASATITSLSAISVKASVAGEISATGGYTAGGKVLGTPTWTAGASALQIRFSYTTAGLIFTASGAALNNIRYALIFKSASAGGGPAICYCSLSSANFSISSPNTLTILPAATGVFTLA